MIFKVALVLPSPNPKEQRYGKCSGLKGGGTVILLFNGREGFLRSKNLLLGNGKKISISLGNGIVVKMPELTIALDPKSNSECKYSFVSHAHLDHVHSPKGVSKVVASKETVSLARARGYDLSRSVEQIPGMELVDAGHILGSRGALIEDRVYYTGDVSTRDRGFLKGFRESNAKYSLWKRRMEGLDMSSPISIAWPTRSTNS